MQYKIYRVDTIGNKNGTIKQLVEDSEFEYMEFYSVEDAFETIIKRGENYCNYTILPYIFMSK